MRWLRRKWAVVASAKYAAQGGVISTWNEISTRHWRQKTAEREARAMTAVNYRACTRNPSHPVIQYRAERIEP